MGCFGLLQCAFLPVQQPACWNTVGHSSSVVKVFVYWRESHRFKPPCITKLLLLGPWANFGKHIAPCSGSKVVLKGPFSTFHVLDSQAAHSYRGGLQNSVRLTSTYQHAMYSIVSSMPKATQQYRRSAWTAVIFADQLAPFRACHQYSRLFVAFLH